MLISLSSLVDKTTLYSMKRFFLSKDSDKMGLKTFAPIATAHYFAHVTQTYCNAYVMHRRARR